MGEGGRVGWDERGRIHGTKRRDAGEVYAQGLGGEGKRGGGGVGYQRRWEGTGRGGEEWSWRGVGRGGRIYYGEGEVGGSEEKN